MWSQHLRLHLPRGEGWGEGTQPLADPTNQASRGPRRIASASWHLPPAAGRPGGLDQLVNAAVEGQDVELPRGVFAERRNVQLGAAAQVDQLAAGHQLAVLIAQAP